ncbi:MAG: thioredoxin-like (seleno)protein SaoT [Bariatricus sp.]|nr:thioredoxin-like (seleno)protein SaoT [Bariatricus sp.]
MEKPCIEYISACARCEVFGDLVQVLEKEYEGRVNVKIYRAGKDFDYIKKYGATTKSMLIINEKKAITKLTKPAVRQAFEEALKL